MTDRRAFVPVVVIITLLFAATIGVLRVAHCGPFAPSSYCQAMITNVENFPGSIKWTNGFTESGTAWSQVLTDGLTEADAPSRSALARAVARDPHGYRRVLSRAPNRAKRALERNHALLLDPTRSEIMQVQADQDASTILASESKCGFAP